MRSVGMGRTALAEVRAKAPFAADVEERSARGIERAIAGGATRDRVVVIGDDRIVIVEIVVVVGRAPSSVIVGRSEVDAAPAAAPVPMPVARPSGPVTTARAPAVAGSPAAKRSVDAGSTASEAPASHARATAAEAAAAHSPSPLGALNLDDGRADVGLGCGLRRCRGRRSRGRVRGRSERQRHHCGGCQ